MDIKMTMKEFSQLSTALGYACGVIEGLALGCSRQDVAQKALEELHAIHDVILAKLDITENVEQENTHGGCCL